MLTREMAESFTRATQPGVPPVVGENFYYNATPKVLPKRPPGGSELRERESRKRNFGVW
jgi:hypothetical protein